MSQKKRVNLYSSNTIILTIVVFSALFALLGFNILGLSVDKSPDIHKIEYAEGPRNYEGFIIEFDREPVILKKHELEDADTPRTKKKSLEYLIDVLSQKNIDDQLADYKQDIKNDRDAVISKIKYMRGLSAFASDTGPKSGKIVLGEYQSAFNGIALNITEQESNELKGMAGVKSVYPNYVVEIMLTDSPSFLGVNDIWKMTDSTGMNVTGKNITISIIDTGIDYTHPDLGGCFGPGCKVVGGYDIYNDDSDPMDDHGHGTHVAGIAAGNGVLKGVAPDATLYAYKTLSYQGSGFMSDIITAIEMSVDPDQNGDFSDHVDVISMSLGGLGDFYSPESIAVDNAVSAGVVVVVAAGNSGPQDKTILSPGVARKAITVGASYNKNADSVESKILINDNAINAIYVRNSSISSVTADIIFASYGVINDFAELDASGKIVLIERGQITTYDKTMNAIEAGAVGVIIFNNGSGIFSDSLKSKADIPVVTISGSDGALIKTLISSNQTSASLKSYFNPYRLADFSSRGPAYAERDWGIEFMHKPDIVAPGVSICAARLPSFRPWVRNPKYGLCLDENHVLLSGTSMATPHVSGMAALLIQAHPEWTSSQIKDAIKNTAIDIGMEEDEAGSGLANITAAISLSTPTTADISTRGAVSGFIIDINGTASGEFSSYTISYKKNGENASYEICTSSQTVVNGRLCSFAIGQLNNQYDLVITMNTGKGQINSTSIIDVQNTKILNPRGVNQGQINIIQNNVINVTGNSIHPDFSSYDVKWCRNSICSSNGVTLPAAGQVFVTNSQLASIQISALPSSGIYDIVLSTKLKSGKIIQDNATIYYESSLIPGWPRRLKNQLFDIIGFKIAEKIYNCPVAADIDNDGDIEILISSTDKYGNAALEVFRHDGEYFFTPLTIPNQTSHRCPSVGDIDGDRIKEIVWALDPKDYVEGVPVNSMSKIAVISPRGDIVNTWPVRDLLTRPVLADITGDNISEIIVKAISRINYSIHAFNMTGMNITGFPYSSGDYRATDNTANSLSVFVADFDLDRSNEIIYLTSYGVNVLDNKGNLKKSYPNIYRFIVHDINNDGLLEITAFNYSFGFYSFNNVGEVFSKNKTLKRQAMGLIAADINNDGFDEIIVPYGVGDGVIIYNATGDVLASWKLPEEYTKEGTRADTPIVADIDNDGSVEIIYTMLFSLTDFRLLAFNPDGTLVPDFPKRLVQYTWAFVSPMAGDFNGDGLIEMVAFDSLYAYMFRTDTPYKNGSVLWPMYAFNPDGNGLPSPVYEYKCGDGTDNQESEECDNGLLNGILCNPQYNSSCIYCTNSCKQINVTGPRCGDRICRQENCISCSQDCGSCEIIFQDDFNDGNYDSWSCKASGIAGCRIESSTYANSYSYPRAYTSASAKLISPKITIPLGSFMTTTIQTFECDMDYDNYAQIQFGENIIYNATDADSYKCYRSSWDTREFNLSVYAGETANFVFHSNASMVDYGSGAEILVDDITIWKNPDSYCGNNLCDIGENQSTCPNDCKSCTDLCPKQEGVCQASRYYCSNSIQKGCMDSDYENYNSSYEASESTCDDVDNDCDGLIDEGGICCNAGWQCIDNETIGYRTRYCSTTNITSCERGCLSGACITDVDQDGIHVSDDCNDDNPTIGLCTGCSYCQSKGINGRCSPNDALCGPIKCPVASCGEGGCAPDEASYFSTLQKRRCFISGNNGFCAPDACIPLQCVKSAKCGLDSDSDGVPDLQDKCPFPTIGYEINPFNGCPIPRLPSFVHNMTINLSSEYDLTNLTNMGINVPSKAAIRFLTNISLIKFNRNTSEYTPVDLSKIIIEANRIKIDTSNITAGLEMLNVPTDVIFYNLMFTNPVVMRDGAVCTDCIINSYDNGTINFTVPGFSEYYIEETPAEPEMTSSASPPASSGSGGGGGGGGSGPKPKAEVTKNMTPSGQGRFISRIFTNLSLISVTIEGISNDSAPVISATRLQDSYGLVDAYEIFELRIMQINISSASSITVMLKVDSSWFSNHSLGSLKFMLLNDSKWSELAIEHIPGNPGFEYYISSIPNPGIFAITADKLLDVSANKTTVSPENTTKIQPLPRPSVSEMTPSLIASGVIIFVFIVLLVALYIKLKDMKK